MYNVCYLSALLGNENVGPEEQSRLKVCSIYAYLPLLKQVK